MNIKTVNNTTGITNANVNLAQNSGSADRTQITVPSGLSPIEAGKALLMQLSTGDRLTGEIIDITPVSYTHLDVYKRQGMGDTKRCGSSP